MNICNVMMTYMVTYIDASKIIFYLLNVGMTTLFEDKKKRGETDIDVFTRQRYVE